MSLWSCLKLLASAMLGIQDPHWNYTWISYCMCDGDPTDLDLHVQTLHKLQKFTDEVDVGMG